MILFINACVRENSRTKCLADHLLGLLQEDKDGIKELRLDEIRFPCADQAFLNHRDELIRAGRFDDPLFALARQFAAADTIVIAAPFWDFSFPAMLKQYFEQINVTGITFEYRNDRPYSLCRAGKLYYVTTAGGPIYSDEYGFGYVKGLSQSFYGIQEVHCFKAENLDIAGADVDGILEKTKKEMDERFSGSRQR